MNNSDATKQKTILSGLVSKLNKENPDLYYAESHLLATAVLDRIKSKPEELEKEQLELVKNLGVSEILSLLSYKSNCC